MRILNLMVALLLFRDNPCSGCKGPEEAPEFAESSQFGTPMCHQFLILMCLQFLLYTLCRSYRDQLEIACRLSCPGSVPSFNARRLRRLRRLRRRQVLLQRNHRGKQLGRPTAVSGVRPQDAVPYDCTTRLVDSCWHPCRFNGYIGYIRISLAVSRSLDLEWPGYHWIIFDIEHTSLQSSYGTGMTKGYKRHEGRRVDEFVSTCLRNASCKTLKESPIYLNMNNKITVP